MDIAPVDWQLRGDNIMDFSFKIYDADGAVLATAHRKFASMHGIYDMDILDESKADALVTIFIVIKHIVDYRGESTATAATTASAAFLNLNQ